MELLPKYKITEKNLKAFQKESDNFRIKFIRLETEFTERLFNSNESYEAIYSDLFNRWKKITRKMKLYSGTFSNLYFTNLYGPRI